MMMDKEVQELNKLMTQVDRNIDDTMTRVTALEEANRTAQARARPPGRQ